MAPRTELSANEVRTKAMTLDTTGEAIDLTLIGVSDDVKSITLLPLTISTVEMRGKPGNDWVNIKGGVALEVDFKKGGTIPHVRATATTKTLYVIATVRVPNP